MSNENNPTLLETLQSMEPDSVKMIAQILISNIKTQAQDDLDLGRDFTEVSPGHVIALAELTEKLMQRVETMSAIFGAMGMLNE